jgi:Flp pilus assembly pilin Flp
LIEKLLNVCTSVKAWAESKQKNLFFRNDSGATMIDAAISMAVGLIVLVAVFSLAPLIGSNLDMAGQVPAGSQWNTTENADLPTGVEVWEQNATLLILAVMVSILSLVIWSIMRVRGESGGGGI